MCTVEGASTVDLEVWTAEELLRMQEVFDQNDSSIIC